MIEKGANDWNGGLSETCWGLMGKGILKGSRLFIVKLMIDNGATKCDRCDKSMSEHL
jgi:hypothetical protein